MLSKINSGASDDFEIVYNLRMKVGEHDLDKYLADSVEKILQAHRRVFECFCEVLWWKPFLRSEKTTPRSEKTRFSNLARTDQRNSFQTKIRRMSISPVGIKDCLSKIIKVSQSAMKRNYFTTVSAGWRSPRDGIQIFLEREPGLSVL